ncbi:MAG TPA: ABC transporter permease [Fimbriiglobus sp.]|jgi:hypothetical protein
MLSSPLFAIFILDREPIAYKHLGGLVQAWLQDAGGFAALGLAVYILYAMLAGSEASPSSRERMSVTKFMVLMGVLSLACYLVLFGMIILKKGGDPNEVVVVHQTGYTYHYEPPKLQNFWRARMLTLGGLFAILGIGQPFARDLLKLRFRRIWALSKLGFKEAVRNKLFWGFVLFLVPFLFPAKWWLDIKPENELRSTVSVTTFWASVLTILPAALLASFAIPNDIKNQTIFTILTKPVERFEVILGRFFGYTGLLTVALLGMTLLSLLFIETTKLDESAVAETYRARVPLRGTLEFKSRKSDFKGTLVGREFEYRKYISGAPNSPQRAIWNFDSIPSSLAGDRPGDSVPCEFAFNIFHLTKGEENHGVVISITFTTWQTPLVPPKELRSDGSWDWVDKEKQRQYLEESKAEYAKLEKNARDEHRPKPPSLTAARPGTETWELVNRLAEKYGYYEYNGKEIYEHSDSVPVPVGLFKHARDGNPGQDESGAPKPRLQVAVKCDSPSQLLGMAPADLYILEGEKSYSENYFRVTFGLWCRVVLVIGLAVSLSTYLAGVIALLGTCFLFLSGYFSEHIEDLALGTNVGGGPFRSLTSLLEGKVPTAMPDESAGTRAATILDSGYTWVIRRFANLVPDVEGFSWSHFLREGFNVDFQYLVMNLLCLIGYLLPWGVLAYYLLRSREVAN